MTVVAETEEQAESEFSPVKEKGPALERCALCKRWKTSARSRRIGLCSLLAGKGSGQGPRETLETEWCTGFELKTGVRVLPPSLDFNEGVDWTPAQTLLFLLQTRTDRSWRLVPRDKGFYVEILQNFEWKVLGAADYKGNKPLDCVVLNKPEHWADPLGVFFSAGIFGARITDKTIYLVDSYAAL